METYLFHPESALFLRFQDCRRLLSDASILGASGCSSFSVLQRLEGPSACKSRYKKNKNVHRFLSNVEINSKEDVKFPISSQMRVRNPSPREDLHPVRFCEHEPHLNSIFLILGSTKKLIQIICHRRYNKSQKSESDTFVLRITIHGLYGRPVLGSAALDIYYWYINIRCIKGMSGMFYIYEIMLRSAADPCNLPKANY